MIPFIIHFPLKATDMARKEDIGTDITLELNGVVSPNQMAKALNAFSALLGSGHKLSNPDARMKWTIQVKKGSSLIEFHPQNAPVDPAVIANIQAGLKQIEADGNRPEGFDDNMMRQVKTLADIPNGKTAIGLWLNKEKTDITTNIKSNVKSALAGPFEEYGAIEGVLKTLDAHADKKFVLYERLHHRKITCVPDSDEIFDEAYRLFDQRVEAEGLIKYSAAGIALEMSVNRFHTIPEPIDYRSAIGILKRYA